MRVDTARFIDDPLVLEYSIPDGNQLLGKHHYSGTHSVRNPGKLRYVFEDPAFSTEDFVCQWMNDLDFAIHKGSISYAALTPLRSRVVALVSPIGIIADIGAGDHLMNWNSEVESAVKGDITTFSTASGITTSTHKSFLPLPGIGSLEMHLLPNSPTVVSVGKLNVDFGIGFEWLGRETPYFILPGNRKVPLTVVNGVPIISEETLEHLRDFAYRPLEGDESIAIPAVPSAPAAGPSESELLQLLDGLGDDSIPPAPISADKPVAPLLADPVAQPVHDPVQPPVTPVIKRPLCEWFSEHSLTHMPSHPVCHICSQAKQKQCPAYSQQEQRRAEVFGGRVHLDSVGGESDVTAKVGWRGERFLHVIHDDYTRFPYAYPSKDKLTDSIVAGIKLFAGSQLGEIKMLRIDNAREFKAAAEQLKLNIEPSPPHRHESHGRAEAFNRTMFEGVRSALLQSGLGHAFWPVAAQHFAFNYARLPLPVLGNQTPYFLRYSSEHNHQLVPFGRGIFYIQPDRSKQPKWDPSSKKGVVIGDHHDVNRQDGSLLILDFQSLCDYLATDPESRSSRDLRIVRTKSWKLSPELFPIANFTSKLAVIKAAFKSAPEHLPTTEAIEQAPAPVADVPLADDDWRKYRPIQRVRKSTRPPEVLPELWNKASPKQKAELLKRHEQDIALLRVAQPATPEVALETRDPPALSPGEVEGIEFQQGGSSSSSSALPATKNQKIVIFEFCCDSDSNLYESAVGAGLSAERLSLDIADLSTVEGVRFAFRLIDSYIDRGYLVYCHAAVPCTPWTAWQHYNLAHGSAAFKRNLKRRRAESAQIINNWKLVAQHVKDSGGYNSFEWPRYCSGWHLVKDFFATVDMQESKPDGCALGSVSVSGDYIKKPWSIWSSFRPMLDMFRSKVCDNTHIHVPCAGASTKVSGHYPRQMTDYIIDSIVYPDRYAIAAPSLSANARTPANVSSEIPPVQTNLTETVIPVLSPESEKSIQEITRTLAELAKALRTTTFVSNNSLKSAKKLLQKHREKDANAVCDELPVFALVHRLLTRSDPEYHSDGAKASLHKELTKLLTIRVWEHDNPQEWDDVKRKDILATIARLFPITSLKHAETDNPEFKSRIVLQGSNVKDVDGNAALFGEISSNPSNLNTIRHGVVYSGLDEQLSCEVSDAVAAYVQHILTEQDGPWVYVRLPREWLPASAKHMRDPCFKMLRPLYGHPAAGRIWETHLDNVITRQAYSGSDGKAHHWEAVPSFPNTWTLSLPGFMPHFLTVYVDDFVLVGPELKKIWTELRKEIELTDPTPISKVLGCNFKVFKDPVQPTVTIIEQEMKDFFKSCTDKYAATAGSMPLKHAEVPYLDSVDPDDDSLPVGVMKAQAASLLMKPFYGARSCRPELIYTITFLARYVTIWTTAHDRMLHRLYCYIWSTLDTVLVSKVDSRDLPLVQLDAYPDADFAGCKRTSRSTSGGWFELGSGSTSGLTQAALEWSSKRQSATATSTSEAEMSSAASLLKNAAVPSLGLWERLLKRPVPIRLLEDNQATLKIMQSGYSAKLRHMGKTQRVEMSFVTDVCQTCGVKPEYIKTDLQKGDFLTKGLTRDKHCNALDLVGLRCKLCAA